MFSAKTYNVLIFAAQGCFLAYDIVYFHAAGLPIALIALAASGFDLSSILAEVPSSIWFDRVSPKLTLAVGALIRIAGFVLFAIDPSNFWIVLVGQVLTGLGSATESGATSALYIAERQAAAEPHGIMEKWLAELSETIGLATVVGGVVGAALYVVSPPLIWVGAALIYVAGLFVLARLKLPPKPESLETTGLARAYWVTSRKVLTSKWAWLLIGLNAAALSIVFLWQLRLGSGGQGVWLQFIGLIAMNVASAVAGRIGQYIGSARRVFAVTMAFNAIVSVGIALTSLAPIVLAAFFVHVCLQVLAVNFLAGKVHETIDNNERASAFSTITLIDALIAAVIGPIVGYLADNWSLDGATLVTIPIYAIVAIGGVVAIRQVSKTELGVTGEKSNV